MNVNEFKSQIKIILVIQHFLQLNKKGKNHWAICPFHKDTKPSLSISEDKNIFKCFSCGAAGDAISFVMKYENIDYFQALKIISSILKIDLDIKHKIDDQKSSLKNNIFQLNELFANCANKFLYSDENKETLNYLKNKRHLNDELIKKYQIGFCPKKQDFQDVIEKWNSLSENNNISEESIEHSNLFLENQLTFSYKIIFPIKDQYSKILGFTSRSISSSDNVKYLNLSENIIFKKSNNLYNIHNIENNKPIYLFEGIFDLIKSEICGINNSVALLGLVLNHENIQILKKKSNQLILSLDNDDAGTSFTLKIAKTLIENGINVYVVYWKPEKIKDIDELINEDISLAKEALKNPLSFIDWYKNKFIFLNSNNYKNINLSVQELLEIFFYIYDDEIQFKKNINIEYARDCLKEIFNLYKLIPEYDNLSEEISVQEDKYQKLIFRSILNQDKKLNKSAEDGYEKNKESDEIKSFFNFFCPIIIEWITNQKKINENFHIDEWKLSFQKINNLEIDSFATFIFDELLENRAKNESLKKYQIYISNNYEKKGFKEFFRLYFLLHKNLLNFQIKNIKNNLALTFPEILKIKHNVEDKEKLIDETSSKIFKKIITF